MSLIKSFRKLLVKFDFFPATQFLRYKGQKEYRTATGGVFTILIIIIFCIFFLNALQDVITKKNVTVKENISHQATPSQAQLSFGPAGGFLFAVKINGMNLSGTDLKYFDINFQQNQFTPLLQLSNSRTIPLQSCTKDHFNFTNDTEQAYQTFNGSNMLCPPLNVSLEIKGKATSQIYKRLTISIKKCNKIMNSNCASDLQVLTLQKSLGYFGLTIVLINTQLNPAMNTNYRQYYLEQKNFFAFTTQLAVRGNAQIESYRITTDQSIIPLSENLVQTGIRVPELFQYSVIPVLSDTYALIHFQRSSTQQSYTRSFGKLDTLFAYVGGLIGTILGLIFILDSYNQLCYKLSISSRIFTYEQGQQIKAEQFNFLLYIVYLFSQIFNRLICCKTFRKMRIIKECQEEIQKQLDVAFLLKKMMFFERVIFSLSQKNGLQLKGFFEKKTLDEIKIYRLNYDIDDNDEDQQSIAQTVKQMQKTLQAKNSIAKNMTIRYPPIIDPIQTNPHQQFQMKNHKYLVNSYNNKPYIEPPISNYLQSNSLNGHAFLGNNSRIYDQNTTQMNKHFIQ